LETVAWREGIYVVGFREVETPQRGVSTGSKPGAENPPHAKASSFTLYELLVVQSKI
jgi:hypothetical protein